MVSSTTTLSELAAVDAELEALTVKLERARQKKAAMQAQKERKAAAAAQAAMGEQPQDSPVRRPVRRPTYVAPPSMSPVSPDTNSNNDNSNNPPHHHDSPANKPVRRATVVDPDAVRAAQDQVVQIQQPQQHHQQPIKGPSEMAKQKHQWDKPDWALPTEALPDDSIQSDSIENGLKQAQPGYERKVHAADLKLISGKFVKASPIQKPDPRLVWIVVNIDGMKVGKIVMHLYGNFLPIVDVFLELKGLEVQRQNTQQQLVVNDMDPTFYIHSGTPETFQGPKSTACFGVVIEGHEVVQQVRAADAEALITIKQSHIYPVKKAKS